MYSREQLQLQLNQNRCQWGKANPTGTVDVWSVDPNSVTENDVVLAGVRQSCPVIKVVMDRDVPNIDNWRSYTDKSNFGEHFIRVFIRAGRPDLYHQWTHAELRKKGEVTHWDTRKEVQYPQGINPRVLASVTRLPIFYLSDFFKNLDHIVHGAYPKLKVAAGDESKFSLHPQDFPDEVAKARDINHLCALVAAKSAKILNDRGIPQSQIIDLLVTSFAKTGTIREYGQQKPADRMVDAILKETVASGVLPGFAKEFRQKARSNVRPYYQGQPNPRLHKTK